MLMGQLQSAQCCANEVRVSGFYKLPVLLLLLAGQAPHVYWPRAADLLHVHAKTNAHLQALCVQQLM